MPYKKNMSYLSSPCRFTVSSPLRSTPSRFCNRTTNSSIPLRTPISMSHYYSTSDSAPITSPNDAVKADDDNSSSSTNNNNNNNNDDVLIQYVVLRRDLIDTWPLGSVVTQGCHASVSAIWSTKDDPHTLKYCSPQNIDSMHKVTLEVKGETQIVNLSEKLTAGGIAYKLWIEQPENIPTCLATQPYPKSSVSSYFKKLKLCK